MCRIYFERKYKCLSSPSGQFHDWLFSPSLVIYFDLFLLSSLIFFFIFFLFLLFFVFYFVYSPFAVFPLCRRIERTRVRTPREKFSYANDKIFSFEEKRKEKWKKRKETKTNVLPEDIWDTWRITFLKTQKDRFSFYRWVYSRTYINIPQTLRRFFHRYL